LPKGKPRRPYASASFGASAAVSPGDLEAQLLLSNPHPFHDDPLRRGSNADRASQRFFI
jgi:hypothetical protein